MKKSLVLLGALTVAGCGISETEQTRIAQAACSALSATSEEDSLDRIQIINGARQELGAEIYSGSTKEVERYLRFGTCIEFIIGRGDFQSETARRDTAFKKMNVIADSDKSKDFDFDVVTDDGSYFFWISESNGQVLQEYVLDSESLLKVQNAEIKGDINVRIVKSDETGNEEGLIWTGELERGRIQASVIDGQLEGAITLWHANGQKKVESNYVNGLSQGLEQIWWENGNLSARGNYVDGGLTGMYQTWHENGQLELESQVVNFLSNGLQKRWNEDGVLIFEGEFVHGERVGKQVSWHDNGEKKNETDYKDGKRNGKHLGWNSDGTLYVDWNYINGKREGKGLWYGKEECYKNNEEVDMSKCA